MEIKKSLRGQRIRAHELTIEPFTRASLCIPTP
jgi:hypothetical protein